MEKGIHRQVDEIVSQMGKKDKPQTLDISQHKNIVFVGKTFLLACMVVGGVKIANLVGWGGRGYDEAEIKPRIEDRRSPASYNNKTSRPAATPTPLYKSRN